MLLLTRVAGECIYISTPSGEIITVMVMDVATEDVGRKLSWPRVRIGIDAPREYDISRDNIIKEKK